MMNKVASLGRKLYKLVLGPIKYWRPGGYDARKYWEDRFSRYGMSFRGSGHEGFTEQANALLYARDVEVVRALLEQQRIELPASRVLEVGCGTGAYTQLLRDAGVREYLGVDLTDILFPELRSRFPDYGFQCLDVTRDGLGGPFDLVVMIDVVQHIVSREDFEYAIRNVWSAAGEEALILLGPLASRPARRRHLFYVRFWGIDDARPALPPLHSLLQVPFRHGLLLMLRKQEQEMVEEGCYGSPA